MAKMSFASFSGPRLAMDGFSNGQFVKRTRGGKRGTVKEVNGDRVVVLWHSGGREEVDASELELSK